MDGVSDLRAIEIESFARLDSEAALGAAPMLQWVRIADLVVDGAYQRELRGAGRKNVRRIAEQFSWSKFATVIVAPVEGGRYAIIDGQHRVTAAALRGIESVPCQVVIANQAQQADAFKSINGQVTRISSLSVHRAAVTAGDAAALEIAAVTAEAAVTILPYPKQASDLAPGETLALGAIRCALRDYDREVAVAALRCVTGTANNQPGALSATVIKALVATLGGNVRWCRGGARLLAAFEDIDLEAELQAAEDGRRRGGMPAWELLAERLKARLRDSFAAPGRAA